MLRRAILCVAMMMAVVCVSTPYYAYAQQAGAVTAEVHPSLSVATCTSSSGCQSRTQSVVLDANWRWIHRTGAYDNCYDGNQWSSSICPNPSTCSSNCALEGAQYQSTYGIANSGNALTLGFVTGTNVGSRVYLMDQNDRNYQIFKLKNREFSVDVDVSNLPCGLNGALYFVEMDADGGMSRFPTNRAGAKFGTGYCDAQCPQDIKFINGLANSDGWTGSSSSSGNGKYGACCAEMDIWEANKMATAFTPHPCSTSTPGQTQCEGLTCGAGADRYNGICDKDGCDFNSFRMGNKTFYGPGLTVDTNQKMTVVTQFFTVDGTDTGDLKEIRRIYIQNGKIIKNSATKIAGVNPDDSITDSFCSQAKTAFQDTNHFATLGGMRAMGTSLDRGMVLVLSIWDDHAANMLWLDSNYPTNKPDTVPGVARGPCPTTSGVPANVEREFPRSSVQFSNIRWGDIGSTHPTGTPSSSGTPAAVAATSSASSVDSSGNNNNNNVNSATTASVTNSGSSSASGSAGASSTAGASGASSTGASGGSNSSTSASAVDTRTAALSGNLPPNFLNGASSLHRGVASLLFILVLVVLAVLL
eukprot:TRINITY_DN4598_c0_g1_i3.p1 TRINITY_DN4598_c0_g1~~TRINITY_DN4598_c0_g1_i3.p1  ORF type:complete len:586 (-),score=118.18 TRINITY_DN4598_c0_g1_i3:40-1797(-)